MSLFDWVEVGADSSHGEFSEWMEKNFPGSYSITFGDALSSVLVGGQQAHIYGDSVQYTVDWEGIIEGFLGKIPGVHHALTSAVGMVGEGLVAGIGGYANFIYGRNTGAVYGTNLGIQRGASATVTCKSWLFGGSGSSTATPGMIGPITPEASKQQAIDDVVEVIVSFLSAAMILTGLITEVLAATVYKQPSTLDQALDQMNTIGQGDDPNINPPPPPPDSPPPPPPPTASQTTDQAFADVYAATQATPPHQSAYNNTKMISWMVTTRMMGLIAAVEQIGLQMRDAVYKPPSIEEQLKSLESDVTDLQADLATVDNDLKARIQQSKDDAEAAAEDVEAALSAIRTLLTKTNTMARNARADANRMNLAVAKWGVAADGLIRLTSGSSNVLLEATGANGQIMANAKNAVTVRSGSTSLNLQGSGPGATSALLSAGATGTLTLRAGVEEVGCVTQLSPEETTIQVGATDLGASISMTPETITLSVGGPEGSTISLTPLGITMKVGTVVKEITEAGITEVVEDATRELTAEGHVLTAAETVMNISGEGIMVEAPTSEEEYEAAYEINITIQNITIEATLTQEVTLIVVE